MPEAHPLWFDAGQLPGTATDAYVAWIDVMGVRAFMLRSLPVTANFVFKLHVAALEEADPAVRLYPVMDGLYVVTSDRTKMRAFLKAVFLRLADCFCSTTENEHRFLVKCAVAKGPVIHGSDIGIAASPVFGQSSQNEQYKDSILLGMPMVLAVQSEPQAPPFGVYVHSSASDLLTSTERKHSHIWWHWFSAGNNQAQLLRAALPDYFTWCERRAGAIEYDGSRIRAHRDQVTQYLVDA